MVFEQVFGLLMDVCMDVFGVGVLFYFVLQGYLFFIGEIFEECVESVRWVEFQLFVGSDDSGMIFGDLICIVY